MPEPPKDRNYEVAIAEHDRQILLALHAASAAAHTVSFGPALLPDEQNERRDQRNRLCHAIADIVLNVPLERPASGIVNPCTANPPAPHGLYVQQKDGKLVCMFCGER